MKTRCWWVAFSSSHGWPRWTFRVWWKPNEYSAEVTHLGLMAFGRHFEVRWGPMEMPE